MPRTYTPDEGASILRRLADLLVDRGNQARLRKDYAFAVRRGAVQRAAGRPTPQAPMVARGLRVKGGTVLGFPRTTVTSSSGPRRMDGVSFGAEFGSSSYPQFGPRRESGYFLNPAAEAVNDRVGLDWIGDTMDAAFSRFGRGE